MGNLLTHVLARRRLTPATMQGMSRDVADGILAEVTALRERNAELARQLCQQLTGNRGSVELKPEPDGMGYFYGTFADGAGVYYRLDVMPPRDLWTGDVNPDGAAPDHWVVYLNGEEVDRAAAIGALSPLNVVLARRAATDSEDRGE